MSLVASSSFGQILKTVDVAAHGGILLVQSLPHLGVVISMRPCGYSTTKLPWDNCLMAITSLPLPSIRSIFIPFFLPMFNQVIWYFPFFRLQLSFALPGVASDREEIREFASLLRFTLSFFSGGGIRALCALEGLFQSLFGDGCIGGIKKQC